MKPANLLFTLIMIMCIAASCESTQKSKDETASNDANKEIVSLLKSNECFDEKMEAWFIAFNKFQDAGQTMEEANQSAIAAVDAKYKTCSIKDNRKIASSKEFSQE